MNFFSKTTVLKIYLWAIFSFIMFHAFINEVLKFQEGYQLTLFDVGKSGSVAWRNKSIYSSLLVSCNSSICCSLFTLSCWSLCGSFCFTKWLIIILISVFNPILILHLNNFLINLQNVDLKIFCLTKILLTIIHNFFPYETITCDNRD